MDRPSASASVSATATSGPLPRPVMRAVRPAAAIFDQLGAHVGVLDHHGVVEHGHVGHAAVGVARVEIGAEQRILLGGRHRRARMADQVLVGLQHAAEFAGSELLRQHAHRNAGAAGLARGPIGDRLRAAEAALRQDVVEIGRALADQVREDFPLLAARQIRAGRRAGQEELRGVARLLGQWAGP